jgi:hypothetical protein
VEALAPNFICLDPCLPTHTPQHNGLCERKHRYLLETTRCVLHQASLPPSFWSYAAQKAAYLTNLLPIPTLKMNSSLFTLFNNQPNYNKLKSFGCLCFPWLMSYTTHKLQPCSEPCVFLGYSLVQSAYIYYNLKTNKFYRSRQDILNLLKILSVFGSPLWEFSN